jgi:hypothetical protein
MLNKRLINLMTLSISFVPNVLGKEGHLFRGNEVQKLSKSPVLLISTASEGEGQVIISL